MLEELSITNFAIIDRLDVRFDPGFNVLTGETGAGKSIIIDAVGAVLGGRVSADMVRSGAPSARVEGIFTLDEDAGPIVDLLREHDLLEDGEGAVILRREINANGRSTARVNGRAVPVSVLGRIGETLVDIHGQSEHLSLFRVEEHVELLDRYAAVSPLRADVAALVGELRRVRRERDALEAAQADAARRLDLLRYQVDEIVDANLRPEEEDELAAEKRLLGAAERLTALAGGASDLLNGAGDDSGSGAPGVLDGLNTASVHLGELVEIDESQRENLDALNGALYTLEEVARALRSYASAIEADPGRLAEIEERLDLLQKLKRKYGATIADVIAFGEESAREQETLTNSEERLAELAGEIEDLKSRIGALATRLSERRHEAATRLAAGVEGELADLNMARARFVARIEARPDPNGVPALVAGVEDRYAYDERGVDRVEFLISPNPGEELKGLAKIASGGEASRLMLALKTMLSAVDRTPTLIFDEVDTGVGGRSGQVVGEKLRLLGETHQVLCITHLPQVAALGAEHLRISKRIDGGRTHTEVEPLTGHERVEELAAMLGGFPPPPTALKTAEELLARGQGVVTS